MNKDYERGFADGYLSADRERILPFFDSCLSYNVLDGYLDYCQDSEKNYKDIMSSAIDYLCEYMRVEIGEYYEEYEKGYTKAVTDISLNLKNMKNIEWYQKRYLDLIQSSLISSFSSNNIEVPTEKIKQIATTFAYIFALNYKYSKYENELKNEVKLLNSPNRKKKQLLF